MVLGKLRLFTQTPKHRLKLNQSSTKQLPFMLAWRNWSRAVLMDQHSLLSPALHSVANLMSLSHCCKLGKAEDEQSQKNFSCAEVRILALKDWRWQVEFSWQRLSLANGNGLLDSCACTLPKCSLYQARSQLDTPPQKPPQSIFHCQEPQWLVPAGRKHYFNSFMKILCWKKQSKMLSMIST